MVYILFPLDSVVSAHLWKRVKVLDSTTADITPGDLCP